MDTLFKFKGASGVIGSIQSNLIPKAIVSKSRVVSEFGPSE